LAHTALKKLNGARFRSPSGEMVETNAIGRGTIAPVSSFELVSGEQEAGSMARSRKT
jgi:hypothetical protein